MRKWTLSACVVLAWCILPLGAAAGSRTPGPSQANTGTAVSNLSIVSRTIPVLLADESVATGAARVAAGQDRHPATRTVRPGDTLSAIAAAAGVSGGWRALYAANRGAVGPDPNVIRVGTVLALPGAARPARYTVVPGDTLAAIAVALGIPGGWRALYAANRSAIGANPNAIRPGTTLSTPNQVMQVARSRNQAQPVPSRRPQAPSPRTAPPRTAPPRTAPPRTAPPRTVPSAGQDGTAPVQAPPAQARPGQPKTSPAPVPSGGMPQWLEDVLIAAGILMATAFAAEPATALARRRNAAQAAQAGGPVWSTGADGSGPVPAQRPAPGARPVPGLPSVPAPRPATAKAHWPPGGKPRLAKRSTDKARIILADHERLIVTYSVRDHTVYVLTPPGEDPRAVLSAARLVLPEDTYRDLVGHLGMSSAWPPE